MIRRNNYSLVILDGSFLLTRALFALSHGNPEGVSVGSIMRVNLQTINRLSRDWGILGDKVMIIWDKWEESYEGYIRSHMLKGKVSYKGSRTYISKETLDKIERTKSAEVFEKAKRKYELNILKQQAKSAMIEEFPKLGIQNYCYPGYEFDDIATLVSFDLNGKTTNNNIIVTKDTDLQYSLSPGCDYFSLPTYGSKPRIIKYSEMYNKVPKSLRDRGIGLYQYNAMMNAAGFFGHNDLKPTRKAGSNPEVTLLEILDGNYSKIVNQDLYELQYNTYNIWSFPGVDNVRKDIQNFLCSGSKGSLERFREFCKTYSITEISDSYYQGIISKFNEKYFTEND